MEIMGMSDTVAAALIGAAVTVSMFLAGWVVKMMRERTTEREKAADRMAEIDKAISEGLSAVRAELVNFRDTLKEWTRAIIEARLKEQRKEFKQWADSRMRLMFAEHREECAQWRESVTGQEAPFKRTHTAPRGVDKFDSVDFEEP